MNDLIDKQLNRVAGNYFVFKKYYFLEKSNPENA